MRSTLLILTLALAGAGLGLWAGGVWDARRGPGAVARIGDPAPEIELPDLSGRPRRLSEWAGRPRLVNFWASWCGPCIEEMPLLNSYSAEQAPNGTQVVGIALDEPEAVKAFLAQVPIGYPTLVEAAGRTDSSVKLGNSRAILPFSVLIDAEGRVSRLRVGAFEDRQDLTDWAAGD